jgi:hypothetical protein
MWKKTEKKVDEGQFRAKERIQHITPNQTEAPNFAMMGRCLTEKPNNPEN